MKLYSDILKGKEMDHTEIPMETAQGISVASEYGLDLIPGPAIKPDGNCNIELAMYQMKRFVYYLNDYKNNQDTFPSLDHALRTSSVTIHKITEYKLWTYPNRLCGNL